MDQRIVKPVFWPVLVVSCILLAAKMYFLIGGMLGNRLEDYFIVAIIGVVMFIAARTVQGSVSEPSSLAVALMFFWPIISIASLALMVNALGGIYGNVGQVFTYLSEINEINAYGLVVPRVLERSFLLSAGIISAIIFIVVQTITCALLFIGTKPEKKDFRH